MMSAAGSSVPLFSFEAVGVRRADRWILDDVTVDVPPDGVTAIVGPSGAGKTTLLRLCNRLEVPDAGTIAFRGHPLPGVDVLRHRRRVGLVFQQPVLFGGTVRDNLLVARPDAGDTDLRTAVDGVGLPETLLDAEADRLSTGEAQRVCLARTLLTRPSVLLLDEPTSALDPGNRWAFEQRILTLVRGEADTFAEPVPTLWVTHDHDQLRRVADHVLALDGGRLVHAGRLTEFDPGDDHDR
jgi:putative ABC transport system ATP-binding protein